MIKNLKSQLLSDNWYHLYKYSYDLRLSDGSWEHQQREAYDRGNGAAILLYNKEKGTIVLTRQFRLPTFVNGNDDGMMVEVCAGLLDENNPEDCIRKEVEEETGYKVSQVQKVMEAYMSPGSVTEILYLFIAEYDQSMKIGEGGGLAEEQENIEVIEMPFADALGQMSSGDIKDAKTIMLLQYAQLNRIFEAPYLEK